MPDLIICTKCQQRSMSQELRRCLQCDATLNDDGSQSIVPVAQLDVAPSPTITSPIDISQEAEIVPPAIEAEASVTTIPPASEPTS